MVLMTYASKLVRTLEIKRFLKKYKNVKIACTLVNTNLKVTDKLKRTGSYVSTKRLAVLCLHSLLFTSRQSKKLAQEYQIEVISQNFFHFSQTLTSNFRFLLKCQLHVTESTMTMHLFVTEEQTRLITCQKNLELYHVHYYTRQQHPVLMKLSSAYYDITCVCNIDTLVIMTLRMFVTTAC